MCLGPEEDWPYANRKMTLVENSANNGKLPSAVAMQQALCNNKSVRLSPFMVLQMFADFLAEGTFFIKERKKVYMIPVWYASLVKCYVAFIILNLWGFEE